MRAMGFGSSNGNISALHDISAHTEAMQFEERLSTDSSRLVKVPGFPFALLNSLCLSPSRSLPLLVK